MLKKIIGVNGSPRTGWNTSMMVKKALEGARSAGAETEFFDLSKLNFKPCMSCMACKKGGSSEGKCHMKDDLSPILDKIKKADGLIIGSPIYWGAPAALAHSFIERLCFSNYSYAEPYAIFGRKMPTALLFTMNYPEKLAMEIGHYDQMYKHWSGIVGSTFGSCDILCAYNTLQVKDYSKYNIKIFKAEDKYKSRSEQFPLDLEKSFSLGKRIASGLK